MTGCEEMATEAPLGKTVPSERVMSFITRRLRGAVCITLLD